MVKFAENGPTMTGPPRGIAADVDGHVVAAGRAQVLGGRQAGNHQRRPRVAARRPAVGGGSRSRRGRWPRRRGRGRGADATVAVINGQIIAAGARGGGGGGGGGGRGNQPPADIRVSWHKHRGPGDVTYDTDEIRLLNKGDANLFLEAKTNAYFSEPGEYVLRGACQRSVGRRGRRRSVLLDHRAREGDDQVERAIVGVPTVQRYGAAGSRGASLH